MYLRTTKRRNKDGSSVKYYQLAHNERHPDTKVPTQRIIHSFGRADDLDRDVLVRLCKSIARVCQLEVHDRMQAMGQQDFTTGLPDDIEFLGTTELGVAIIIEALWERLDIGPTLRRIEQEQGYAVRYERALLAMTANRLCDPQSKLGVWDRWLATIHLPSCQGLKRDQMYQAMDLLHAHAAEIEKAIFFRCAHLFNLEVDIVFYDTTTATFSVDDEDEDGVDEVPGLRKYGHAKEGGWSTQVIVALAVTREGFPIRSWVFPGNTSDVTTVKRIKEDLKGWQLGRALFVADSGMNSAQNREDLAKACGKYLLAARMASVREIKEEVLSKRGRYAVVSENLHAKEVVVGDGARQRRYILCRNLSEAKRQKLHREKVIQELEEELSRHPDKTATARWALELKSSGRYGRYLKIMKNGKIRIDRGAVHEASRYDGKWVIQTNDDTISVEDAAEAYKSLLIIEGCFRSLKRVQIKMTPMHHRLPERIEAHVKICVLALLISRVVEHECGGTWFQIREALRSVQVSQYRTKKFQFFQRNSPSKKAQSVFEKLATTLPKKVFSISSEE